MTDFEKGVLVSVLLAWAALAVTSVAGVKVPPPADWLEAWTKWIAAVVAIVVSARVLWSGAAYIRSRVK